MIRIATLALTFGLLSGTAVSQQVAEFSSYYSGNRYDFYLTHKDLLNTPAWLDDEPNPPLPARTAQSAALSYLRTMFDNAAEWRLEEIKLMPIVERWVYVVSFSPPTRDCQFSCMTTPFSIIVRMDGNAVTATVSRWEPPTPANE